MRSLFVILLCGSVNLHAEDSKGIAFAAEALDRIEDRWSVRGDDEDWFFLVKELRHIATGRFWEKPWEEVAMNGTDPLPSIVEFHELLAERGIELLLVPVPAKAAIFPEKLSDGFELGDPFPTTPFLEQIRKAGVNVLDLETRFRKSREEGDGPLLYCRQDAHFSPAAIELVSEWIAEELGIDSEAEREDLNLAGETFLRIQGDLVAGSQWDRKVEGESLPLRRVSSTEGSALEPDDHSSILLLGDSHTLVFHQGGNDGMHSKGAGVFDHLSYRVGFPLALVGKRASGLVEARKQLFYTATSIENFWDTKKAVVWMFSVREFTQSTDRIVSIPLDRP